MNKKSRTLLLTEAYLKWSTIVLITMHFKMILPCSFQECSFKEMHSALFPVIRKWNKLFVFSILSKFVVSRKKNENALEHVLISSNCTKHIQAGDTKVFCGYLKHVVVVCLRSNFMFLCGRLLGSFSLFHRTENNY